MTSKRMALLFGPSCYDPDVQTGYGPAGGIYYGKE